MLNNKCSSNNSHSALRRDQTKMRYSFPVPAFDPFTGNAGSRKQLPMMVIQMTGLSGAGKTTLANGVKHVLTEMGYAVEVLDGDEYRQHLCRGLGFSRSDREENIRRLGVVASVLAKHGIIAIIAAINPYESARQELCNRGDHVKLVWVHCDMQTLLERDTKDLYAKAHLPVGHPDRIEHLTGVSDPFETPAAPDLIVHTHTESEGECIAKMVAFVEAALAGKPAST
jgi:adenylylsulfate kinase